MTTRLDYYKKAIQYGYAGATKWPQGSGEFWRTQFENLRPAFIISRFQLNDYTPTDFINMLENLDFSNETHLINLRNVNTGQIQTYTINQKFINSLFDSITEEYEDTPGSGTEMIEKFKEAENFDVEIERIPEVRERRRRNGEFYPYINLSDLDLSRYQIYKSEDELREKYKEICLINCFIESKIFQPYQIEFLKSILTCKKIPLTEMKNIAKLMDINISVRCDKYTFNYKSLSKSRCINLGLLEGHYFIIDDQEPNIFNIIKNLDKRPIDLNYWFILDQGLKKQTQIIDFVEDVEDLQYDENSIKLFEFQEKEKKTEITNVFFDFETYTDTRTNELIPFIVCWCADGSESVEYEILTIGEKSCFINRFLNKLSNKYKSIRLIAHNVNFDYKFMIRYFHVHLSEIINGGRIITGLYMYSKMTIEIKDSYNLIQSPLKSFANIFRLEMKKEAINYNIYNEINIKKGYIPYESFIDGMSESDIKIIDENIKLWNCGTSKGINIIRYCLRYCVMDVKILKQGYNIFKGWFIDAFNLDIDLFPTMASIAHFYLGREGCFKDIYYLSGKPQYFISKAIEGGRCMTAHNKKCKSAYGEILDDLDANSLYPSAMYECGGFPKGKPKIIKRFEPDKYTYFVAKFRVLSVGKSRAFPVLSERNKEGIRMYKNEFVAPVYIDKVKYEDAIKYQDIKFSFICGYYWDEGTNNKVREVKRYMYDQRNQKKKEKNPIETTYKLMMNSAYGRSILGAPEYEIKYIRGTDKKNVFVKNHYQKIINITQIDFKKQIFKIKLVPCISQHFNMPHVGTLILSYSKRIMNRIMYMAEDHNIKIYYTDTDSIHLTLEGSKKLMSLCPDLIGSDLGQLKSEFTDGKHAIRSVFLGKKAYLDVFRDGSTHIRMKGCGEEVIKYYCEQQKISVLNLYELLYLGFSFKNIDLTRGGKSLKLDMTADMKIFKKNNFTRSLKFQ